MRRRFDRRTKTRQGGGYSSDRGPGNLEYNPYRRLAHRGLGLRQRPH
jgi:hypothetical protein